MTTGDQHYFVPEPSRWPIIAVVGIFVTLFGVVLTVNDVSSGPILSLLGLAVLVYLFTGWFGDVIREGRSGSYNDQVSVSFRQAMAWFIASEVFFFAAFFGSLFYIRTIAIPSLAGEGHLASSHLLWEGFKDAWPLLNLPDNESYVPAREAMGPLGIPLLNTVILLTSGATITWAHWGLKANRRGHLVVGLALTVLLGVVFLGFQAYEYVHAYEELGLTLKAGVYGSTFYMLTGFHGLHVTMGTIMLIVILLRSMKGHFTPKDHFGFEGVAWYWHFVDFVWLGLYVFVYWL
ncbi:cytochrome c oxidase subunit 3 [Aestuariirhabdus litorea]|uniref:cytochrome-c oxidase n=1 Tax=Aestuariirhabdus litorea TaxID=2528527 RepID=A0A3P3VJR5_9GAMM|nr:cytochrome c oxidase subunit 3 [Aestuariirhabdus litorea]RRJ82567.1 cytochrome c oxidase subunit 3 [Aestuariirhabdus litorea]RWW92726.1 cytochrome c oxidase subunit 3 [Endozoicomonadaceae bacterium GTF-13]